MSLSEPETTTVFHHSSDCNEWHSDGRCAVPHQHGPVQGTICSVLQLSAESGSGSRCCQKRELTLGLDGLDESAGERSGGEPNSEDIAIAISAARVMELLPSLSCLDGATF